MAVLNKNIIKMMEEEKNSYLKLRQSLDSFNDVLLAEFNLTESPSDKEDLANFVSENIRKFLKQFADDRREFWDTMSPARAKDFADHSRELLESLNPQETAGLAVRSDRHCPPGFHEIDGICVPI